MTSSPTSSDIQGQTPHPCVAPSFLWALPQPGDSLTQRAHAPAAPGVKQVALRRLLWQRTVWPQEGTEHRGKGTVGRRWRCVVILLSQLHWLGCSGLRLFKAEGPEPYRNYSPAPAGRGPDAKWLAFSPLSGPIWTTPHLPCPLLTPDLLVPGRLAPSRRWLSWGVGGVERVRGAVPLHHCWPGRADLIQPCPMQPSSALSHGPWASPLLEGGCLG